MRFAAIAFACVAGIGPALAEPCPGNPDALGVSRTVVVDAATLPLIGTMHYQTSVPLQDREVLLTFDDGPRPPYTDSILDALAAECVKATFFMVGFMARAAPDVVRRVYNEGHNVASHSQNHSMVFGGLGPGSIASEVGGGFATLAAAVGDPRAVAPFFRAPGLAQNRWLNSYLAARATSLWSTDTHAWDWTGIRPAEIVRGALAQLDAKGHGVVLLHDLQPATALAMPELLRQLKVRGYRIVHAVPPGERPKSVPELNPALIAQPRGWPRTLPAVVRTVGEPEKAPTERIVPLLADGRGALPPTMPPAMNAAMGPIPERQPSESTPRDGDITNGIRRPAAAALNAARKAAPRGKLMEWTLFGGWKEAQRH